MLPLTPSTMRLPARTSRLMDGGQGSGAWGRDVGRAGSGWLLAAARAQGLVHAAAAVALEIERDVAKAEGLQAAGNLVGQAVVEDARQLGRQELDAGDVVVVADADLGKSGFT